jgi:hypothetical protein
MLDSTVKIKSTRPSFMPSCLHTPYLCKVSVVYIIYLYKYIAVGTDGLNRHVHRLYLHTPCLSSSFGAVSSYVVMRTVHEDSTEDVYMRTVQVMRTVHQDSTEDVYMRISYVP